MLVLYHAAAAEAHADAEMHRASLRLQMFSLRELDPTSRYWRLAYIVAFTRFVHATRNYRACSSRTIRFLEIARRRRG